MNPSLLSPASENAARRVSVGLVAVLACYLCFYALTANMARILSFIPDDAAYYFEIAENAAAGKGFTFDGLHETNGYQPLWQITLVPVFFLVKGSPETAVRVVLVLQVLLMLAATRLIYGVLVRIFPASVTLISLIVFIFYVFVQAVSGMETALLVFTTALLLKMALEGSAFGGPDGAGQFRFGVVLGLVMLARLDMVFLGAAIEFFCLVQWIVLPDRRRETLVRMALILAGATLVVAPYLLYNQIQFGAMAPISAQLKHGFPHLAANTNPLKIPRRDLAFGLVAAGYLAWSLFRARVWATRRSPRNDFSLAMAVLALGVILHLLDAVLYVKWAIFSWHFISYRLLGVLLLCLGVSGTLVRVRFLRRGFVYWTGICLLVAGVGHRIHVKHNVPATNWSNAAYEAALWARSSTSEESIFAMKDAGNFGFFSQRRTINLDGLVNDMAFQEALKNQNTGKYLTENGLDYLVQHAFDDRADITDGTYDNVTLRYFSNGFGVWGEEITMDRAQEVFRSRTYPRFGSHTLLIIWEWTRSPSATASRSSSE